MKRSLFQGVCTALVTPFCEGKPDFSMLEKLLLRQMEAGVNAIVIAGTTGEAPTLTDSEKLQLFREAKRIVGSRAVILAGTGCNCTEKAVQLSKAAEDQGADGLLAVTPYYNKCTAAGLLAHYREISRAISIPMILYNVPSRTGVDIPLEVYRELAREPNIVGVKEASPDLRKIADIIRTCPEDFTLYSGNDDLLLPVLALGGKGVISVVSNVKPRETAEITGKWFAGDIVGARKKFMELLPLMKAMFSEVNPIPVKKAMQLVGFDCGSCRLPLTGLSAENTEKLRKYL